MWTNRTRSNYCHFPFVICQNICKLSTPLELSFGTICKSYDLNISGPMNLIFFLIEPLYCENTSHYYDLVRLETLGSQADCIWLPLILITITITEHLLAAGPVFSLCSAAPLQISPGLPRDGPAAPPAAAAAPRPRGSRPRGRGLGGGGQQPRAGEVRTTQRCEGGRPGEKEEKEEDEKHKEAEKSCQKEEEESKEKC